jgi:hypothetical protein
LSRKKKILLLLLLVITQAFAPETVSACSACMFQLFDEYFPFLTTWGVVFLGWSVVFILWYFASPKGKALSPKAGRICLELVIIFLLILFTGYSVLLLYWAFFVARHFVLAWKKNAPDLSPGVRKFSFLFNGLATVILAVSVVISYAGYNSPKSLVKRLGKHYGGYGLAQANLRDKIIARGVDAAPELRKAVLAGISDPRCKEPQNFYGPETCMRAENAAGLLGDIKDSGSLDVLVSAATATGVDPRISDSAKWAIRKIGKESIFALLRASDGARRAAGRKALAVLDEEPIR